MKKENIRIKVEKKILGMRANISVLSYKKVKEIALEKEKS